METVRRDHSRALSAIGVIALLAGLLLPGEQLRAQEVDKDGHYSRPFLVLDPDMHTAPIRGVVTDAAGRYIITGSHDKSVRVWSANDGRLLRTIRLPSGLGQQGSVFTVAVSPDGNTIAAGGYGRNIFLFERATGRQVGHIGTPGSVNSLAFSRDGRRIAAGIARSDPSLRLFDVNTRTEIAFDDKYKGAILGISFDTTGRIATTSEDRKLRLYNGDLRLIRDALAPGPSPLEPLDIAFSPDNKRLAVGYTGPTEGPPRVDVVDGQTLVAIFAPRTTGYRELLAHVAWSVDGSILYAGNTASRSTGSRDSLVFAWKNSGRGSLQVFTASSDNIAGIQELSDGRIVVGSMLPSLSLFDRKGSVLWQHDASGADFRGQTKTLKVSLDGKQVLFHFDRDDDKSSAAFDVSKRTLDLSPAPRSELIAPRVEGLPITDWRDSTEPKIQGKPLAIDRFEVSRSLAITRDARSFWLGTGWRLRHFNATGALIRKINTTTGVWALNLAADDRLVVAAVYDGTIRWYRSEDGAELLAFYPHSDRKRWVAWTPLGHYAASPGAEDLIQWQINRGLDQEPATYSASRFRDQFYRPDVIERVLDTLDPNKALEAADDAAGRQRTLIKSIAETTPPRVAIVDPADATFIERPELVVAYTMEDRPGTVIKRIRLMLDGTVVAEEKNRTLPADGRMAGEFRVLLQGEQSLITLLAENEHGSSDPSSVRIRRNPATEAHKRTLYVLAVGVGQFKNHRHLKLNFADADASAFVKRVVRQEHGLYSRVLVRSLVNEEATQRAILDGLVWLERSMTARDVAAVFISTHGANDAYGELHLLPHEVDLQDEISLRSSAVRYGVLKETLKRLADRGKTLLFLDACHSGNVLPGAKAGHLDVDKMAADLASAENGVVVFSSSTGKQFSMEYPTLGHGAFTAALLEAFDGRSDLQQPPWLRVSDLEIWLSARVKELTNGAQTPTTTIPGERFTNPRVFMTQQDVR
jgi:WD40 repeat protein